MTAQTAENLGSEGLNSNIGRLASLLAGEKGISVRSDSLDFNVGDTVRVHARIVEGSKERIQIFEGVVIRRKKGNLPSATFTVRKVSYNIGVERTFFLHSPRVERIEVVSKGHVRRSKLYYLRDLSGKKSKIKKRMNFVASLLVGDSSQDDTLSGDTAEAESIQSEAVPDELGNASSAAATQEAAKGKKRATNREATSNNKPKAK